MLQKIVLITKFTQRNLICNISMIVHHVSLSAQN